MDIFKGLRFHWLLLLLCAVYPFLLTSGKVLRVGSCSQKCQNTLSAPDSNLPPETNSTLFLRSCSCTKSCGVYRDCCPDSVYRTPTRMATVAKVCLPLLSRANYRAVYKCSPDWKKTTSRCMDNIGHLPPVTSKITGITYTNIHCAICNEDAQEMVIWNVNTRCCEEHDNLDDPTQRRFIYRRGHLYSVIPRQYTSTQRQCMCAYFARNGDSSFIDSLELRTCGTKVEISTCSQTWRNESTRDLCESFIEPVYVGHKVYRNLYCAQCNYENLNAVHCQPDVIGQMIQQGWNETEIFRYCEQNEFRDCLHYFSIGGRGRQYGFSRLLNIRENECVPRGNQCCEGERYDFRYRRCRKLAP